MCVFYFSLSKFTGWWRGEGIFEEKDSNSHSSSKWPWKPHEHLEITISHSYHYHLFLLLPLIFFSCEVSVCKWVTLVAQVQKIAHKMICQLLWLVTYKQFTYTTHSPTNRNWCLIFLWAILLCLFYVLDYSLWLLPCFEFMSSSSMFLFLVESLF